MRKFLTLVCLSNFTEWISLTKVKYAISLSLKEIILIDFKREEGTSSEWILSHVRAGQEVFSAEILAAGFEEVIALPILKDNYVVRFRKNPLKRGNPRH